MVFTRDASFPSSNLVPFGSWWHARSRGHCRGKPGRVRQRSSVSGEYAPDYPRAEGSSIVDESGEEC